MKKSISAAQRRADPHAGPHGSFPLDAEHVHAAWMLAGHAANPAAVRAKILAWARRTGNMDKLPSTARSGEGKVEKAKGADVAAILTHAYHASTPDSYARRQLLRLSAERGLLNKLPPDAHTDMHAMNIPHEHPNMDDGIVPRFHGENEGDIQDDPDDSAYPMLHDHVVSKAFSPKATYGTIVKSWSVEGSEDVLIEGWMSTPERDLEKDITEPEAFQHGPLAGYFARSAPLSLEHGTDTLPAGHLQKAAILRNGKVLETADHPHDPAEFTHLPDSGSGVWVRAVINEEPAKSAIQKGNIGGMSFIGNFTQYEPLPGGGKRYRKIDPLIESTVAAYPVNPKAAFSRVKKALGLPETEQGEGVQTAMDDDLDLIAMLDEAAARAQAKAQAEESSVQKGITAEQLGDLLKKFEERLEGKLEERVQKAMVPAREEGVGRKGGSTAGEGPSLESDPVNYLIKKSQNLKDEEDLTQQEKNLAGRIFVEALSLNMTYGDEGE